MILFALIPSGVIRSRPPFPSPEELLVARNRRAACLSSQPEIGIVTH